MDPLTVYADNKPPSDTSDLIGYNFTQDIFGDNSQFKDWRNRDNGWKVLQGFKHVEGNQYLVWFEDQ